MFYSTCPKPQNLCLIIIDFFTDFEPLELQTIKIQERGKTNTQTEEQANKGSDIVVNPCISCILPYPSVTTRTMTHCLYLKNHETRE